MKAASFIEVALAIVFAIWMTRHEWAGLREGRRRRRELNDRARLSSEEAAAIGRAAVKPGWLSDPVFASLREEDGRLLWGVGDLTIGSSATATVDDATGAVVGVEYHHTR